MGETVCLRLHSVVWGKVGAFPWWPGKIVQQLRQQHHIVYKVSFFGDASYSFLLPEHILPFQDFDFQLIPSFDQDFKLQKAVRLANTAFARKSSPNPTDHDSSSPEPLTLPSQPLPQEPIFPLEPSPLPSVNNEDLFSRQITSENVVELIELMARSRKTSKCYASRKEANQFKQKLADNLLQKYKLHRLEQLAPVKQKLIVKVSKTSRMDSKNQRIQAIKKIQKSLFAIGTDLGESKCKAIELYQAMQLKSSKGEQKIETIYVKMLSFLRSSPTQPKEDMLEICERNLRE